MSAKVVGFNERQEILFRSVQGEIENEREQIINRLSTRIRVGSSDCPQILNDTFGEGQQKDVGSKMHNSGVQSLCELAQGRFSSNHGLQFITH